MKKTYTLSYGMNYPAHADHLSEIVALGLNKHNVCTSSEIVVQAARCLIVEGKLDYQNVIFMYMLPNGHIMKQQANCEGRLVEWSNGYCDYTDKFIERILLGNMEHVLQDKE